MKHIPLIFLTSWRDMKSNKFTDNNVHLITKCNKMNKEIIRAHRLEL